MNSKNQLLFTILLVAVGCWSGTAAAQNSTAAQTDPQSVTKTQPQKPEKAHNKQASSTKSPTAQRSTIAEVTVTARRMVENIQTTPVAVTAVSQLQMERMHPHDLADLNHIAPNFTIQGSSSLFRNSAIAFARGIGYNNIDGTLDPRMGISVDGVFYLRNVGVLQDMFDLNRVEILLGPQGTLYGKNTIAGVINLTTNKPKLDEWQARAWLRFGNLGRKDSMIVGNIPLGDTLAARIAYHTQYSVGPYTNIHTDPVTNLPTADRHPGGDDTKTIRASLRWVPNDHFDLTVVDTVLRNRSPSVGGTNIAKPGSLSTLYLGHPGYGSPGGPSSPYTVDRSWPSGDWFDMDSLTVHATYHGKGFDVISISNYMTDNSPLNYDDFTYSGLLDNYAIIDHRQYSEELRIQSTGSGPLHWVAGGYYDHGHYNYWQSFYNNIPVVFGAPSPIITNQWIFQWSHSLSGFGQVDYSPIEKLQLTAGIRILTETKRALDYAGFTGPTTRDLSMWPAANIVRGEKTWSATIYHLGARYEFTDNLMSYVSYSTGFHSGGFNSAALAGASIPPAVTKATFGPWNPEKAKSFEAGVKSNWLEDRLQLDLTGFWVKYEDLQSFSSFNVNASTGLTAVGPANGGQERARGLELQTVVLPVPGLHIRASVGYLDAEYTSFHTFRNNLPYDCVAHGCDPVRSPRDTARLDASYDISTSDGTITPSVTYSWTASFYTDTFNDPVGRVGAYGTVDAAVAYHDPSGRWSISLWGKNLTDKRYFTGFIDDTSGALGPVPAFAARYYANPRTYGIQVSVNLNQSSD